MPATLRTMAKARLTPLLRRQPRADRQGLLAEALDLLPLQPKVLLSLYYDQELTMAELALVLEVDAVELRTLARAAVEVLHTTLTGLLARRAVEVA